MNRSLLAQQSGTGNAHELASKKRAKCLRVRPEDSLPQEAIDVAKLAKERERAS